MHLSFVILMSRCLPFQLLLCVVHIITNEVWDTHEMSSEQKVVYLVCDVPAGALISFLVYNLLLVLVCTILAFKTRHLPDNFNESLFIAMCVTSTLILWGCFIIVYTLSPVKSTRIMSMAIALLCNHSVALIFLFLSRVCAVLFDQSNTGDQKDFIIRVRKGTVFGIRIWIKKELGTHFLTGRRNSRAAVSPRLQWVHNQTTRHIRGPTNRVNETN